MPVFGQVWRESWRSLIGFAVALVAVMSLYVSFYSTLGSGTGVEALMGQLPEAMVNALGFRDIGSGAGWTQSTFFGVLGLFILCAAGIAWGTAAIAGDEESGMLELTLAHRVSRGQLYLERLLAIVARMLVLGLAVAAGMMLLDGPVGLELDFANIPAQITAYLGVGLVCASVSLAVGAIRGERSAATGAGAAALVVSFLLNALGNLGADYEWMHAFSPVSWAYRNRPLLNGWDLPGVAWLYGTIAVLVLAGWLVFRRRDVTG